MRHAALCLTAIALVGAMIMVSPVKAAEGEAVRSRVGATIKPVHSLLSALMIGVGKPTLIFPNARKANDSDGADRASLDGLTLVFRIGARFEEAGLKPLMRDKSVQLFSLMTAPGVRLLDIRPGHRRVGAPRVRPKRRAVRQKQTRKIKRGGIVFRTRDGKKVIRARRNGVKRRPRQQTRSKGPATQKTGVSKPDPNIWLDPRNAIAMARYMAGVLVARDPGNTRKYKRNLAALIVTLESVDSYVTGLLRPLRTHRFAVLNNRLQYFEEHFLLRPAIELKIELHTLTAEKAQAVGKQLRGGSMRCILAPTRATPAHLQAMQPGGKRRVIAVDPYGDSFDAGAGMYELMMRSMGETYGRCLALSTSKGATK